MNEFGVQLPEGPPTLPPPPIFAESRSIAPGRNAPPHPRRNPPSFPPNLSPTTAGPPLHPSHIQERAAHHPPPKRRPCAAVLARRANTPSSRASPHPCTGVCTQDKAARTPTLVREPRVAEHHPHARAPPPHRHPAPSTRALRRRRRPGCQRRRGARGRVTGARARSRPPRLETHRCPRLAAAPGSLQSRYLPPSPGVRGDGDLGAHPAVAPRRALRRLYTYLLRGRRSRVIAISPVWVVVAMAVDASSSSAVALLRAAWRLGITTRSSSPAALGTPASSPWSGSPAPRARSRVRESAFAFAHQGVRPEAATFSSNARGAQGSPATSLRDEGTNLAV